jgi:hypothetical protein
MIRNMSIKEPSIIWEETGIKAQRAAAKHIQKRNTFLIDRILSAIMPQKGVAKITTMELIAFMIPT